MTRYDPFAYGEVRLAANQKNGGPPPDADDLLFDPGEATKQGPPPDTNWSLVSEQDEAEPMPPPDSAAAIAFGSEILGEEPCVDSIYGEPAAGCAADEDLAAAPADEFVEQELIDCDLPDSSAMGEAVAPEPAPPDQAREVRRRPLPLPSAKPIAAAKRRKRATPRRRSRPILAALVPLMLCAGGGIGASWFWVMQYNPVLAGILGAATVVGSLFSWLWLRG